MVDSQYPIDNRLADMFIVSSPGFTKAIYGVGLLIAVQTLGCFFYRLTECTPISWAPSAVCVGSMLTRRRDIWLAPSTPGLNCVSSQEENSMMIGHQAIGIIIDFALLVLLIWVIHYKMMFSNRKIQVILVFSVGTFVVVTGIIRIVMLKTLLFLQDP